MANAESSNVLDRNPQLTQALEAHIQGLKLGTNLAKRRGELIGVLHKAQHLFGYLPAEVQELVAKRLGLLRSDVYGVISFYSYFTDKPVGKYKINVCTGTACFVRGAERIMHEFSAALGVHEGGTTKDMKFTLNGLRCVGACSLAPVVMVNDRVYGKVTAKQVAQILADHP